jgi:uncharacterized RDD family membrane protein YckC
MPYCKKCGNEFPKGAKYCSACGTAVSGEETPATPLTPVAVEPKLAFWGERFVAWIIDVVIIGTIVFILNLAGLTFTWWSGWPNWIPFFNFNVNGVVLFLYWMLMDGVYGQSFGKMVMRLKVTQLDGIQIGMGPATLESVGKAFLLPLDCLIGWLLYPRRRQRIFNYLSRTIVVKTT